MEKEYFYLNGDTKTGPFTLDALKKEAITPDTQVWHSMLPDWVPARTLPELQALFASPTGEESSYNRTEPNYNTSPSRPASPQTTFEAAGSSSSSYTPSGNGPRPPMPENYLVWAILVTVACCLPLGIVSIINATKVSSAYSAGDYEGAEKASKDAKKWAIWGAASGVVAVVLYLLFVAVLAAIGAMN